MPRPRESTSRCFAFVTNALKTALTPKKTSSWPYSQCLGLGGLHYGASAPSAIIAVPRPRQGRLLCRASASLGACTSQCLGLVRLLCRASVSGVLFMVPRPHVSTSRRLGLRRLLRGASGSLVASFLRLLGSGRILCGAPASTAACYRGASA